MSLGFLFLCSLSGTMTSGEGGMVAANEVVLKAVRDMPEGGGYSTGKDARIGFDNAVHSMGMSGGRGILDPFPSFCSSATYIVLIKSILELEERGFLSIDDTCRANLFDTNKKDGEGAWGRWNANGPGAGIFLSQAGIGKNFTSIHMARPGDFAKIHWTDKIGKGENGHLVVFLGIEQSGSDKAIRFWSANKPSGKGEKTIPLSSVKKIIFSRIVVDSAGGTLKVPADTDSYLASLVQKSSNWDEVVKRSQAIDSGKY